MNFLRTTKARLLISLVLLFLLFHFYRFLRIRLTNMDLPKGKIVFSSDIDGDNEIYIMNLYGSGFKQLTKNFATRFNTATDKDPSFSPDGNKIVFVSRRLEDENVRLIYNRNNRAIGEAFSGGTFDIFIMNTNGRNQTPLTYKDLCSDPFFSPNGDKIIYRSNKPPSVRIINITTLEHGILNFGGGQVEFSPDGDKIFDNFKNDISIADINGANMTRLTHFSVSQERGKKPGIAFTLSKDGRKVSIVAMENKNDQPFRVFRFYVMNADGSDLKEVYQLETKKSGRLRDLKYSPRGDNIVMMADFDAIGIYSLDLTNFKLVNLTQSKERWDSFQKFPFTLTPDGRKIIFMANILPKDYKQAAVFYKIKVWLNYYLLRKLSSGCDNKYLCIMDIDGRNYRRIAKLPVGTELGRDFIHWEEK
jgi:Tol biopolymer transport system component